MCTPLHTSLSGSSRNQANKIMVTLPGWYTSLFKVTLSHSAGLLDNLMLLTYALGYRGWPYNFTQSPTRGLKPDSNGVTTV